MHYVLIIHEVESYAEWKKGFDKASKIRKKAGEIDYQVLSYDNNLNKVVHYSYWKSHEKARAFFESDAVKQIRKDLGVKNPAFNYLNQLENGVL
ncbi:MAG: quinol monooxygenase YgiN [Saprospiraceae bacterium]|jgi:quinol monooxygenase YgiN